MDKERQCLVQSTTDGKIKVSLGNAGMKNAEGPYASPRHCFFKDSASVTIDGVFSSKDNLHLIVRYLKDRGIGKIELAYDPTNSIETEEPNHTEIFMGMGGRVSPPQKIYTKGIATCLGVGFYNCGAKQGSLYHIAGAEESSLDVLADVVDREFGRLGDSTDIHFVSGLATIDNKALREIQSARSEYDGILAHYSDKTRKSATTLCKKVGEYISLFSLNAETGLFTVETDIVPHDKLLAMDTIASNS